MAKFEIVPGLTFVDRSGWGADPQFPRKGHRVDRNKRTHIIIHHTVMVDSNDHSPNLWENENEVFAMMKKLQTVRPDLGLDVPYNFVAFLMTGSPKVVICEGRGEDRSGAHTKGHNTAGIAISFAGDFENKPIDSTVISERMPLISNFLGWLKFSASHPTYGNYSPMTNLGELQPKDRAVFFHQDFKNTACPGEKLKTHLTQLTFVDPR